MDEIMEQSGDPRAAGQGLGAQVAINQHYQLECFGPDGVLKWREEFDNLVTNAGLNDVLEQYLKGSAYTAAHYVLLTDGTPTVAAEDTMASHAGWVEVTAYAEATRPALTMGTVASQSVNNSGSKAVFTLNAGATIGGAGITTVATKGGATGTLYAVGAFTGGDRVLTSGDVLNVTVTATMASA